MHVGPRTALEVVDRICPLQRLARRGNGSHACWSLLAIRTGVMQTLCGDTLRLPEASELLRVPHDTLRHATRQWGGLDWSTRLAWLKLADEALLDIRRAQCEHAACDAAAAWMPSMPECAPSASASAIPSTAGGSAHGAGSPRSGVAATPGRLP